jgi:hypothetical protein
MATAAKSAGQAHAARPLAGPLTTARARRRGTVRGFRLTRQVGIHSVSSMKFSKKRMADTVIFVGLAVNAVVIILILYHFVF